MAVPERYAEIDFKPTQAMADAAARGLEYRRRGGGGGLTSREAGELGIGSGVQRAVSIKMRSKLSPTVVKQMVAFFSRHARNRDISPGKQPWEDRGYVAWLLWGGDPGKAWANARAREMARADEQAAED